MFVRRCLVALAMAVVATAQTEEASKEVDLGEAGNLRANPYARGARKSPYTQHIQPVIFDNPRIDGLYGRETAGFKGCGHDSAEMFCQKQGMHVKDFTKKNTKTKEPTIFPSTMSHAHGNEHETFSTIVCTPGAGEYRN